MSKARIAIVGDSSSYQRSVREAAVVTNTLSVDMKKLAVSAESSAALQVKASVAKTARLRSEIAAYREIAAAARIGSREQVAAADLAARAQARLGRTGPRAVLSTGGAARVQVLETVKQTEALRAEAVAYREVAAVAVRGSQEQITAANLAASAERRLAGSMGVAAHEAAALRSHAGGLDRDLSRATRGALAGSGVFRGLGRSIAFASGGFLAFATGGQFIRTSIDAAREALVTQKQLGTQLRADGKSLSTYRGEIDQTGLRISALSGFTKDDLDQSLTTILRSTRNVGKALRDEGTAADLARAKHISLSQAALILGKVEANNTTLLRRQGFAIGKHATAEEALAIVRAKVAGQAAAGTTEQERFGAVLHDSEVIIGAGLLPTLNQYLLSGARWLTQMNESGRLQKDVANITGHVTHAFHDAGAVAKFLAGGVSDLNKVTGSTENTLKDFAGVWLLLKARTRLIEWGIIESGIAGVGTRSLIASGEVGVLGRSLLKLRQLGPFVIPIALSFVPPNKKGQEALDKAGIGFLGHLPIVGGAEQQVAEAGRRTHDFLFGAPKPAPKPLGPFNPATRGFVQSTPSNVSGELRFGDPTTQSRLILHRTFADAKLINPGLTRKAFDLGQKVAQAFIDGTNKPPTGGTGGGKPPLSLAGRFNLAELRLAQAQLTKTSADDIRILNTEAAITREQIKGTKNLKDKTALTQKLVGIMGQLAAASKAASTSFDLPLPLRVAQARAGSTASPNDDLGIARQVRAVILRAIPKLHGEKLISAYDQLGQVNQQLADALIKSITPIKLQLAQARATLTPGLRDDVRAAVAIRDAAQKAIKSGKLTADGLIQAYNTIAQANDQIGAFTVPLTLQLREARAAALNKSLVPLLRKEKAAAEKALKSGNLTIQGQIDAWNDITRVNAELGGAQTKFKKADLSKLVAGFDLTAAEKKALKARLSQVGAGGSISTSSPSAAGGGFGGSAAVVHHTQINLDGKPIANVVTRHQQKTRRRNPPQKRGPHAGG